MGFALVLVAVLVPAAARADPDDDTRTGAASVRVYADDDHMTVVSPSAGAQAPVGDAVTVDVAATADIISGASVDVVSEASPTAIHETRVELGAGATWRARRVLALRSRVIGSHEDDYQSLRWTAGVTIEVAARTATVDLEYVLGVDRAGSVVDPAVSESRALHRAVATVTRVVDRRTYVDLAVDVQRAAGFHASTYRTVPIVDPATPVVLRVPEVTPEVRAGVAARAGMRRAIGTSRRWFAHADYRYYRDDWSIASHTVTATGIAARCRGRLQLGVRLRGYTQSSAAFYRPRYELDAAGAPPALRTRERRLGPMQTLYAGVTVDWQLRPGLADSRPHLVVGVAGMRLHWPDFPAQAHRNAAMITASVDAAF